MSKRQLAVTVGRVLLALGGRAAGKRADVRDARRILVVRCDEIGDAVLTTPFLRELRRSAPAARVTLVARDGTADLFACCPHVDEVIALPLAGSDTARQGLGPVEALRFAVGRLWRRRVDLAVLPRWEADVYGATFVAYASGARWRVGFSERSTAARRLVNEGYDAMLTTAVDDRGVRHEVERTLTLLAAAGGTVRDRRLELWTTAEDERVADGLLADVAAAPVVVFAPGARQAKRRWPVERFADLGRRLVERRGARVVVVGHSSEADLGRRLAGELGGAALDLVGRTTIRQTVAVLRRARLFVGNDTGTLHMAAAAGPPVIEVSCHPRTGDPGHVNSPVRFGPWCDDNRILQPSGPARGCADGCDAAEAHCILGVGVDDAWQAADELLRGTGGGPI